MTIIPYEITAPEIEDFLQEIVPPPSHVEATVGSDTTGYIDSTAMRETVTRTLLFGHGLGGVLGKGFVGSLST